MEPVTAAASKIAKKVADEALKYTYREVGDAMRPKTDNPVLSVGERMSNFVEAQAFSKAIKKVETVAHGTCKYFGLPKPEIVEGNSIADSMKRCDLFMSDDGALFKSGQFTDMKSMSFEDMSKIWAHDCGHRVMRFYNMTPWAQKLGADFFMGVRSEMLGLPKGNIEKVLGESKGESSLPSGKLRLQAVQYGRETVRDFKKDGVPVTMQNMREVFRMSDFAKINVDERTPMNEAAASKDIAKLRNNMSYSSKYAENAVSKESGLAKELLGKAEFYQSKATEEGESSEVCGKDVETSEQEINEKHRYPKKDGKWDGVEGDSKFIPDDDVVPKNRNYSNIDDLTWGEIKEKYGIDGVTFKDGYPDFSDVSKGNVEIDNFTDQRYGAGGNFDQADRKLASQRGCSPEEVRQWCNENNYTWHEMQDCKTMQKVPREVHGNIPHDGGISKLKNAE